MKRFSLLLIVVLGCLLLTACDLTGMNGEPGHLVIHLSQGPLADFSAIDRVVVRVTAPDIENDITVELVVDGDSASGTVTCPSGSERLVEVDIHADGVIAWTAAGTVDLSPGETKNLSLTAENVIGSILTPLGRIGSYGDYDYKFHTPSDVTTHPDSGNVYVVDPEQQTLKCFEPEGNLVFIQRFADVPGGDDDDDDGVDYTPTSVLYLPATDVILVADGEEGRIDSFNPDTGAYIGEWTTTPLDEPRDMAYWETPGKLLVIEGEGSRLLIFEPDGTLLTDMFLIDDNYEPLEEPVGLALTYDDSTSFTVVVTDVEAEDLIFYGYADGNGITWGGTLGDADLEQPLGVTVINGYLFVCDGTLQQVMIYNADGTRVDRYGTAGNRLGTFTLPAGNCYDPVNEILWIADSGNFRLQKFSVSLPAK
ncbi:hypothetical protein K8R78_01825 [bacterium]|nr:hypothetical protein [bacterium]